MCGYEEIKQEILALGDKFESFAAASQADRNQLHHEVNVLTSRMSRVEASVQAAVLTKRDVQQAINESNVLTREQFEAQLFTTLGEIGVRIRTWIKRAVYGVAGLLAVIAGIILALERIWGVFS